jgi:hypothetical protein
VVAAVVYQPVPPLRLLERLIPVLEAVQLQTHHQPTAAEPVALRKVLAATLCLEALGVGVVLLVLPLQLQQIKVVTLSMEAVAAAVLVLLLGRALVASQHLVVVMAVLAVLTQTQGPQEQYPEAVAVVQKLETQVQVPVVESGLLTGKEQT